jgi:hypothetical protein
MEQHELVYIKKGKRYEPIGQLDRFPYREQINPLGIEVIIRDGDGCSRHWHFASLEAIQNEYDWVHEAIRMRLKDDLCAMIQREWAHFTWHNKSLSDICELLAKHIHAGTLQDMRKTRGF